MKRPVPVAIGGVFLASFCSGSHSHGRSPGPIPTYVSAARWRADPSTNSRALGICHGGAGICNAARPSDAGAAKYGRQSSVVCRMNKDRNGVPSYFARNEPDDDVEEEESSKRGVFRRMRDKISNTFGSSKKGDEDRKEDKVKEGEYKPNPLDALRLRLAVAMSNINPFQFRKDEWVVACPKTRVGPGQIVPCVVNGLDIIIFASRDGQRLDAFANACPHLGSPFDLATIERKPVIQDKRRVDDGTGDGCVDCIVCPVHRTAFEMQSGKVRGEWCPYPPILGGVM
ncbi:hypothetical protein ACHAWF_004214 [Thalassiosira exigua]